jgi:hypothetical protein
MDAPLTRLARTLQLRLVHLPQDDAQLQLPSLTLLRAA